MIDIINDSRGNPHKYYVFMGYHISDDELREMADEFGYRLVKTKVKNK